MTAGAAGRLAGFVGLMPVSPTANTPVGIHLVAGGKARSLLSSNGVFADGGSAEIAGFRILTADLRSDWLAFLGAAYFRAAGSRDQYGLSARGIAIDTGLMRAEEFPSFTDFWIEPAGDLAVRIHALLDGPSLTGAYTFDCRMGRGGVEQEVRAAIFFRKDIERLGIAPATSMFWYGEGNRKAGTDWRPEIHDSDGLAIIADGGEHVWRPLANPSATRVNSFRADHLKGFGLLQRDQRFDDYQDDGAFYDKRPSLWAEPLEDWGSGSVLLYEMPTDGETNDNVVAFWVSDKPARKGERRDLRYRLRWTSDDPSDGSLARALDIWVGTAGIPGTAPIPGARKYTIDVEGKALSGLDRQSGVEIDLNVAAPALLNKAAYPVVGKANRWRIMIDVRPEQANAKELRLLLRRDASALTETIIIPMVSGT